MIFTQNHIGPQQNLCCSWLEDIKREQEKGERVYSGAPLNCRGLSSASVGKHPRVLLPHISHFTSLEHFISRHTVTATCNETDNQWNIAFTYSFQVGASYNIFVTEQDVSPFKLYFIPPSICRSVAAVWADDGGGGQPYSHHVAAAPVHHRHRRRDFVLHHQLGVRVQSRWRSIRSVVKICIFSLAPPSMKSVLQSLFLMTTAVGNLITMAIIEIFSAFDLPQVFISNIPNDIVVH